MREPVESILQGAASALVFAAFAVVAGLVVGWPASDILSAAIIAGCGGAALEHFLRRHYGLAGAFMLAALGLTAYSMRPEVDFGGAFSRAAVNEGESATPYAGSSSSPGGEGKREDRQRREEKNGATPVAGASAVDTIPTTLAVHNPAAVAVSVTYQRPGASIALGTVAGGGTATFALPLPGPLELGTVIARAGDRTVRARVWLRPGRAHQVELPSID